jgi:hypothetical protein
VTETSIALLLEAHRQGEAGALDRAFALVLESLTYKILLTISGLIAALLSTLGLTNFLQGKLPPRR